MQLEQYIETATRRETLKYWPLFITIGFVIGTLFGMFIKS